MPPYRIDANGHKQRLFGSTPTGLGVRHSVAFLSGGRLIVHLVSYLSSLRFWASRLPDRFQMGLRLWIVY